MTKITTEWFAQFISLKIIGFYLKEKQQSIFYNIQQRFKKSMNLHIYKFVRNINVEKYQTKIH